LPDLGISALRNSFAAPAVRYIQGADWSRWYACHQRSRWNVTRHDRSGRDNSVVANGHAGKNRRGATDPNVGPETNWRDPHWARGLHGMMVRVENGHEVAYPAILTQYYAVIGNDRGTSVDEHPFAQHQGSIWAGTNLNRDGLAAQAQTSALD
jgi:hypothetical protein